MNSRTLYPLLAASVFLAWFTSGEPDAPTIHSAPRAASHSLTPPIATAAQTIPSEQPWRRVIDLPAIEPPAPVEPEPLIEPLPLPEVQAPPPPPAPTAPPLPVQYLGQLRQSDVTTLYVRYQEHAIGIRPGERLGEDYRLVRIAQGHAQFRYLPLDTLQELRWDAPR